MFIYCPGNQYFWHENVRCRNAGCSELYILHLLDSFAVIALQHNRDDTRSSSVSVTLSPRSPKPPAAEHRQMESNGESANGLSIAHVRTCADGVVVFIKKPWLRHLPWRCSFFRTAEWQRGLKFPLRLSSPVGDEGRYSVKYKPPPPPPPHPDFP